MIESQSNWMKNLSNDLYLSEINIPGTHDSCAHNCLIFARCQNKSLREQLDAGIRYIDIRCRHIKDTFQLHHAQINLNMNFSEVQDICLDFLNQNSSETIVMMISSEYKAKDNQRSFEDVLYDYISPRIDRWYLNDQLPMLSQVRGKIVLLRRFRAGRRPFGIDMDGWQDSNTFTFKNHPSFSFNIQDRYNTMPDEKWEHIRSHLSDTHNHDSGLVWYMNYCSLYKTFVLPPKITSFLTNRKIDSYLKNVPQEVKNPKKLGTVILDYPSSEIISNITASNF